MRFKKQFLYFLYSFPFKLSAFFSQVGSVKWKSLSRQLFSSFSSFSFFLLFSDLSFYFSFFYLRKYLRPLIHLKFLKQIFSVSFFPFLKIYIYIQFPIFRKGRREKSFKLYLSFRKVFFSGFFLLRASSISLWSGWRPFLLSSVQRFYSTLSRSLANLAPISCQCLSRAKDPFPNFFWRKGTFFFWC